MYNKNCICNQKENLKKPQENKIFNNTNDKKEQKISLKFNPHQFLMIIK